MKNNGKCVNICVYELGVASKRAAGAFFLQKKAFPLFLTMSVLKVIEL